MHGEASLGLPSKDFDQASTLYRNGRARACYPADRVLQQAAEVSTSGKPHGALDISGEVGKPSLFRLPQYYCRLICVGLWGVGEFRRVRWKAWDHGKYRAFDGR